MNGIIKNPGWMGLGQKHRSDESNLQQLGWRAQIDHLWTKVTLSFDVRVFTNKQQFYAFLWQTICCTLNEQ